MEREQAEQQDRTILVPANVADGEPWLETAAIGTIPGLIVVALVSLAYLGLIALMVLPGEHHIRGEIYESLLVASFPLISVIHHCNQVDTHATHIRWVGLILYGIEMHLHLMQLNLVRQLQPD